MKFKKTNYLILLSLVFFLGCNHLDVNNGLKTIEVKFFEEDFQKIKDKRKKALDLGILITSSDDYVGSGIKIDNKFVKSEIRLKGDWTDHLKHKNKWSYRLKIGKGQTINGMRKISLQHPATRNYIYEWVFHKMLTDLGLASLRYDFVNFILNVEGKKKNLGIFALEEAFDKRLIENNKRRSGVIIKFSEEDLWNDRASAITEKRAEISFEEMYLNALIVPFNESKVYEDSALVKEFRNASHLLDGYRKKTKKSYEVFDLDKMGRFMAVVNLIGGSHALIWHNVRFYYNPITALLEPIGFDAIGGNKIKYVSQSHILGNDESFLPYHKKYLQLVEEDSFLNNFLSKYKDEINDKVDIFNSEFDEISFDEGILKHNQKIIKKYLEKNPILFKPDLNYDGEIERLKKFKFLNIDSKNSQILFVKGNWLLNEILSIPSGFDVNCEAGFKLNLENGAKIISASPMFFEGTKEMPIEIYSASKTGEGLLLKNCKKTSLFKYVIFKRLSNVKSQNWSLTGSVTVYQSPADFKHVQFSDNISEDALNVFDSEVLIENCTFSNTFSDAFDGDFVKGNLKNVSFTKLGNDAIDISGSELTIQNITVNNALDKAISVGENSHLNGRKVSIFNSELAIASKDMSPYLILS